MFVVGLGQRRRRAEMAPQIDAMLVSPDSMTKGGGQHVFSFFYLCLRL